MSLVPCRECKHRISDTAKTCPNCGSKIVKQPTVIHTVLSLALFIWIWTSLPNCSQQAQETLPEHSIKYQTKGTMHLQAKDNNLTKAQCLAIIDYYRSEATHQIAVYKLSHSTNTIEPWCVLNKLDQSQPTPFFNDL